LLNASRARNAIFPVIPKNNEIILHAIYNEFVAHEKVKTISKRRGKVETRM
jgi:hypothetical protein